MGGAKNCSRIMVQGLSLECNADSILLCYTTDSTIRGNVIANNLNGITLKGSSNNVISDNQVRNNKGHGISLEYNSDWNIISRNEIVANTKDGVCFDGSSNNNNWGEGAKALIRATLCCCPPLSS